MSDFTRRHFLAAAGLGAAGWAALGVRAADAAAARPNVIVILSDDHGYGDLSCTGAKDVRTPHLDRLAASGMTFDGFYANCTVCSPSRAALLTGRYPDLVGVPGVIRTSAGNSWGYLDPRAPILHALVGAAGYHTAIIGKWHLGLEAPNLPTDRGVDVFKGFIGDMMDDYNTHLRQGHNYMRDGKREINPKGHATDLFTEWASDYLRERAKTPARPFFLYLAYNAPHNPLQPTAAWLKRVQDREPGLPPKRAALVALIEHMDDGIGRVLGTLEEAGLDRNTLVIYVSDNGGDPGAQARNAPFNGAKGTLLEGGLRVFGCAAWPGRIRPGTRDARPLMLMDIFPTVCELAGAQAPSNLDGVSFVGVLEGRAGPAAERTMIWPYREGKFKGEAVYAIRRGRWKLVETKPGAFELFDLETDPGESRPLGREHEAYGALMEALRAHRAKADRVPWRKP